MRQKHEAALMSNSRRKLISVIMLGLILSAMVLGCATEETTEAQPPPVTPPIADASPPEVQMIGSPHYIDLDDFEALFDTFANYAVLGAIGFSWDSPYQISPDGLVWMYSLLNVHPSGAVVYEDLEWEGASPFYYRDAQRLEEGLQQFFDVSAEHLRQSQHYVPERSAYRFHMGGIGGGPGAEMVRAEFANETNLLVLYLETDLGFADFGLSDMLEIVVNRLTIRLREGGTGDPWILPVSGDFMFVRNEASWILRHPETGVETPGVEPMVEIPAPDDMVEGMESVPQIEVPFDLYERLGFDEQPDPPTIRPSEYFVNAVARFDDDELVIDSWNRQRNLALLEEWVENYRQGIPGTVAILSVFPFSANLFVLESDGSATYTITFYSSGFWFGEYAEHLPPVVFNSSYVVRRAYDHVFGPDFGLLDEPRRFEGSDAVIINDMHSIVINRHYDRFAHDRQEGGPINRYLSEWNPQTDAPLAGITPQQAEQRALEVDERFIRFLSATQGGISGTFPSGIYIRQNVLDAAASHGVPTRYTSATYYRTVGAMRLGNIYYYIVYGHYDLGELKRRFHSGNVKAVSQDGRLVFILSMYSGLWIFVDDAQQEIIAP